MFVLFDMILLLSEALGLFVGLVRFVCMCVCVCLVISHITVLLILHHQPVRISGTMMYRK